MGWFGKKEEVPEIPEAPPIPKFPMADESHKKDLPELPSFPNGPNNENFNQEIVKSAVSDVSLPEENEVNAEILDNLHVAEGSGESMIPPKPSEEGSLSSLSGKSLEDSLPKLPMPPPKKKPLELKASVEREYVDKSGEPIFVRIDKFQSAQKNFENVRAKLVEIESTLKKVKDVKSKEDEEIRKWSEEVEALKSKLTEIDSEVFDQI